MEENQQQQKEQTKEPSEQALLAEYHVCEQDNVANTQGFWTLSAIFIGLSSAFLAGLIYAVITNKSILLLMQQSQSNDKSTIIIGAIAIIIGIANVVILQKLKEWQTRIQFNLGINNRRMREVDLMLGTRKAWRIYAIDRWYEILKEKKWEAKKWEDKGKSEQEKWNALEFKFRDGIDHKYHKELHKLRADTLELVEHYFINGKPINKNGKYEIWMSQKHFPWIIHTLMFLWVLVIITAVFLTISAYTSWQWGIIGTTIILAILTILRYKHIYLKRKCICDLIAKLMKKIRERYLDL
jgi:hypothetical protein